MLRLPAPLLLLVVSAVGAAEVEDRAAILGSHCDFIILSEVPALPGCGDGFKFVAKRAKGVRTQYLVLGGKMIMAFVQWGVKFSTSSTAMRDIKATVECMGGLALPAPQDPGAGGGGFCAQVICCGSDG